MLFRSESYHFEDIFLRFGSKSYLCHWYFTLHHCIQYLHASGLLSPYESSRNDEPQLTMSNLE